MEISLSGSERKFRRRNGPGMRLIGGSAWREFLPSNGPATGPSSTPIEVLSGDMRCHQSRWQRISPDSTSMGVELGPVAGPLEGRNSRQALPPISRMPGPFLLRNFLSLPESEISILDA